MTETEDGGAILDEKEYKIFKKMLAAWRHNKPELTGVYFICGEAGEHDDLGLPDKILICPQMGSNMVAVYERPNDKVYRTGQ